MLLFTRIRTSSHIRSFLQIGVVLTLGLSLRTVVPDDVLANERNDGARVSCVVSIVPQAYFVERIGADCVDVQVMVRPGQSPATYEPTARQIASVANSRIYFAIGVGFEQSIVPRIKRTFPNVDIVETHKSVTLRSLKSHRHPLVESGHSDESHRESNTPKPGENGKTTTMLHDPHVWLSPVAAITIAENIRDALIRLDSERSGVYITNCDQLIADLKQVDREIEELLEPLRGSDLFVFHPAYGYFTDAYGLIQVPIEIEGVTPGPKHLAAVIERAKQRNAQVIFVQPQFSTATAQTVAQTIGARIVLLDPLAKDYMGNLRHMAKEIIGALAGPSAE